MESGTGDSSDRGDGAPPDQHQEHEPDGAPPRVGLFPQLGPAGSLQRQLDTLVEPFVVKYLYDPRFAENCAFRGVQTFFVGMYHSCREPSFVTQ